MPSNRRTNNEYFLPEPSRIMGSLEARNGFKKQQNSKIVKEPVQLPQGNKQNLQNCVSQRTAKSSGDCQERLIKGTATTNDELVKHMSNLPGYLQHVEKQENIQEKAFSVGVLDWGHLQKWKHHHEGSPTRGGNNVSSKSSSSSSRTTAKSFSFTSTVPGGALANKRKQLESRKKELLSSETDNKSGSSLSQKTTAKSLAPPRTCPGTSLSDKSKQPNVRKRLKDSAIDLGHSLSDKSKQLEVKKKELHDSKNDDPQLLPGEVKNIVLLLPKKSGQDRTVEEEPSEFSDENLTKAKSPDDFTQRSERPHSDYPHSCPLSSRIECDSAPDMRAQDLALLSNASLSSSNSDSKGNMLSIGKSAEQNKVGSENANNDTLKLLDQEMAELANRKSRNQSPHGRFSFSLSRMGRSFSFREGRVVQQLSSTNVSVKTGLVRAEASGCLDDPNRDKAKAQNRTRSSPLRRMLDPLLKPKSLNSHGFAEILQPLKGSLNSNDSNPINAVESYVKENHESSTIQALMQLTLKDGLPLFRFVVNSSNILAATMKVSPTSGGHEQNFTFYSVNETKRKIGSWMIQASKEKSHGYAYDTIGQMKIYGSHISDVKDCDTRCLIRESVLFGVQCRQATQSSQKFTHNIELAAVVVKMPGEELTQGCIEKEGTNSNTVILPGGFHSLPNKGAPSPLIHRWRSGGSCDCGGWDVGCKLRILSSQNGSCKNQMASQACPNPDDVELFAQEETQRSMPIFSLAPQKHGLYAIEFDSSISALQAFFISVTVICCQKSSNLLEISSLSKERVSQESELKKGDEMESKSIRLGKMPAKYAPNPPLSPVGRV